MIEETAFVVAVEDEQILCQTQRRSACHSCSVKQGCGTSVLAKVVGQRSSQITLPKTQNVTDVKVGDEVVLGIEENALVQGSLLVYTLPLIMMIAAALLAQLWAESQGIVSELPQILSALGGFSISLLLVRYWLNKSALKQHIQPHILRIKHTSTGARDTILAP